MKAQIQAKKAQFQAKIDNLQKEDRVLRERKETIQAKYDRPPQWMKDEDYKAITRARIAIEEELADLHTLLSEIEDQEWADRMSEAYPDGQV